MKLDKETLIKHQFWIGFGVFLPLVLISLLWLQGVAAEDTANKAKALKKLKDDLAEKEKSPPKSKNDVNNLEKTCKDLEKRREEIWERAWKMQEDMMTWPAEVQEKMAKRKF